MHAVAPMCSSTERNQDGEFTSGSVMLGSWVVPSLQTEVCLGRHVVTRLQVQGNIMQAIGVVPVTQLLPWQ